MKKEWKKPLALAIVIALIFFIGLFYLLTSGNFRVIGPGSSCHSRIALSCQDESINTNGQVTFSISQYTEETMYNVAIACIVGNSIIPACVLYGQCAYNSSFIPEGYTFNTAAFGNNDMLLSGSLVPVKNLNCYTINGLRLGIQQSGKRFESSVYVWLKYTNLNGTQYHIVPGAFWFNTSSVI